MINLVGEDSADDEDLVQQMSSVKQVPQVRSPTASSQQSSPRANFISSFAPDHVSASKLSMDIKVEISQKSRVDTQQNRDKLKMPVDEFYNFSAYRGDSRKATEEDASNKNNDGRSRHSTKQAMRYESHSAKKSHTGSNKKSTSASKSRAKQ